MKQDMTIPSTADLHFANPGDYAILFHIAFKAIGEGNMQLPVLIKEIPAQVVNEQAAFGPFDLKEYIQAEDGSRLKFSAGLASGAALPKGLICTEDGLVTGIPGKETHGTHDIVVTARNDAGPLEAHFELMIKPSLSATQMDYIDELKAEVWQALQQNLPVPDLSELHDRPVTMLDIYYLLERWGILTIWDAFNLEPASEKQLLTLEGVSEHYNVYDRGSSLVAAPKDLFSHERTLEDGLKTARAMAREVYHRGWTIELAGFEKLTRAAWIELQQLGDRYGKQLEVINYHPTPEDLKLYQTRAKSMGYGGME